MSEVAGSGLWQKSLWESVLDSYSKPTVEQLSLAWQDQYGANVTLMLWCVWLQRENICLSKDVLQDVVATIKEVEDATLWPLRRARAALYDLSVITRVQQQLVKKQVLAAELSIEKILVHKLQDVTQKYIEVMRDVEAPLQLEDYLQSLAMPNAAMCAQEYLALAE
ncbi:TIGR02444 family protein [Saccharophagus degradans]|uniref:TIGR02444 family protein n=1 Tax=Saccharophagus degradans (strain 2-40 / ATCC 43961 / DSM 17024) TaxID=203122 RepID=Q21EN4_SACD2|nr:TIGR02444 family protein [Saccharophagus degradans]ABD82845.1 conserved hypothetical protein [Saccharophagus degradans 2-40]